MHRLLQRPLAARALRPGFALGQTRPAATAKAAWHLTPPQLAGSCRDAISKATREIASIAARPEAPGALLAVEGAFATLQNDIGGHAFIYNVAPDAAVRDSSTACSQWLTNFGVEFGANPRVYGIAVRAGALKTASPTERQLAKLYMEQGRHNGAALDSATRLRTTAMLQRLADVQRDFMVALASDSSHITLSTSETEGFSPQFTAALKAEGNGFALPVNESTYPDFMRTERSSAARRRFATKYFSRGGAANIERLHRAVAMRDSLAHLFGFPSWAAYQLDVKMAKTPSRVTAFLAQVDDGLLPKAREELARLTPLAARDGIHAPLGAWDLNYYNEQLRKTKYAVDAEQVRQYFPVDHVVRQVMDIYQELLGVKFTEVLPADAWAPGVREFQVKDAAGGTLLGVLYLDLFPRGNKYGHFADFGLTNARRLPDGTREIPVNAIVGNWPLGQPGKPATLTHADVVTFFHEFGHAMSSVCDASPFLTTGSNNLRQDFVEALSQMLENWMWQPAILARVTKHVVTGQPLPDSLAKRIITLKHFNDGMSWTQQAFYASYDMTIHTSGPNVDVAAAWPALQRTMTVTPPIPGTIPPAGFGHFMSGYDAGYYGYLWSLVYAQDLFTRFEKEGVMNAKTGRAYRDVILAPGATEEPDVLLQRFLGRPLSYDAFFTTVGIAKR
jgi:thimet oligopeptidase